MIMYHSGNLKWRRVITHIMAKEFVRKGDSRRCHKQLYRRLGVFLTYVNYDTFMDDVKAGATEEEIAEVPNYVREGIRDIVRELLGTSQPFRK